jgi:Fe2+ or Zn2+ uptake regulation protein
MSRHALVAQQITNLMLASSKHDWTLADVYREINARGTPVNQSTIYRSLLSLERAGKIRQVATTANEYHFELDAEHHDHIVCKTCGLVQEVPCASPVAVLQELNGFVILDHQVTLAGLCPQCREAST